MTDELPPGDRTREDLLAIIRQHGGLHKSELCRKAKRGWGNVGHHVDVLAEEGLVEKQTRGRLLWIFDCTISMRDRDVIVAIHPPRARRILEAFGLQPKATIRGLSEELALSKKVIRHHLSILKHVDVVEQIEGHPPAFVRTKKR